MPPDRSEKMAYVPWIDYFQGINDPVHVLPENSFSWTDSQEGI